MVTVTTAPATRTFHRGHEITEGMAYYANNCTAEVLVITGEHFSGSHPFYVPIGASIDAAEKKARKAIDEAIADAEIRPTCQKLIHSADATTLVEGELAEVGQARYVYAMGQYRRGVVVKVTKMKTTVAYTTASNPGRIYRKAVNHSDALVVEATPAPVKTCGAQKVVGTVWYACNSADHMGEHTWVLEDIEEAHAEALEIDAATKCSRCGEELSNPSGGHYRSGSPRWETSTGQTWCSKNNNARHVPELAEAGAPAGGYPSPYAVATLATLLRRSNCVGSPKGVEEAVEELKGRGFVAAIPGLPLVGLTEAGKEFTRKHVVTWTEEDEDRVIRKGTACNAGGSCYLPVGHPGGHVPSSYGTTEPCSSCNSRNAYHDC